MNAIMKFVHVLAVVLAVGGMHYVMTVLMPVAKQMGPPGGPQLMERASKKFHVIVWIAIVLLLLSGLHLLFARGWLGRPDTRGLMLLKIGLALAVFAISLGLSLPLPALANFQKKRALFLRVNVVLAMIVIFLGCWITMH